MFIEDPVGVNGLIEDINCNLISKTQLLALVEASIEKAKRGECTFEGVYRTWSKYLRDFIKQGQHVEECREMLWKLIINNTVPMNELETPDYDGYRDGYTGEPVSKDDWGLTEEQMNNINLSKARASISDWNHYITTREPYEDPEMNKAFIAANAEFIGQEQEIEYVEDRSYIPSYFEHEGTPDEHLGDFMMPIVEIAIDLVKICLRTGKPWSWIRDQLMNKHHLIERFQEAVNANENYNNLARTFLVLEGMMVVSVEDAELILLNDQHEKTLRDWINLFYEELCEYIDACGPAEKWFELTDDEIARIGDEMLEDYLMSQPVEGDYSPFNPKLNPITRSRAWQQGYIQGVTNGLPSRGTYTASDFAWDVWRYSISPEGQQEFRRLFKQGASRQQAMRGFYKVAQQTGAVIPVKPKRIRGYNSKGLFLTNGKFVNWRVATKIFNEEGYDLTQEDRDRLISTLKGKGWGQGFVSLL